MQRKRERHCGILNVKSIFWAYVSAKTLSDIRYLDQGCSPKPWTLCFSWGWCQFNLKQSWSLQHWKLFGALSLKASPAICWACITFHWGIPENRNIKAGLYPRWWLIHNISKGTYFASNAKKHMANRFLNDPFSWSFDT